MLKLKGVLNMRFSIMVIVIDPLKIMSLNVSFLVSKFFSKLRLMSQK
jgi:hypothetical protein